MTQFPTGDLLVNDDRETGVTTLWLNRPERRHALSLALLEQLEAVLLRIADDRSVRVVVIGSQGPVFSSGHDLGEMRESHAGDVETLFATCARVMLAIRSLPQPVIARVQGLATAAGCQLVAACDLAIASEAALFATPGVKIGLFCTTPMVPLVRAIPPKLALQMLLTGQPIDAHQALAAGLVNSVVPADQLDEAVRRCAGAIAGSSSAVIRLGKREFYEQLSLSEAEAYSRAVEVMATNAGFADAREGIAAFLQKRAPRWRDE